MRQGEDARCRTRFGRADTAIIFVATPDEAVDAAREVGFPCMLKPSSSDGVLGKGGDRVGPLYVEHGADVRPSGVIIRSDAPAIVQELATGERETNKLFRVRGVAES